MYKSIHMDFLIGRFENWSNDNISIKETGEIEKREDGSNGPFKQCIVDDDYGLFNSRDIIELSNARAKAIAKYGAGNHLNIPFKENLSRAMRHIISTASYKSNQGNTIRDEIEHVLFRLMMACDNILYRLKEDDPAEQGPYIDMNDTEELYRSNIGGAISLFPSVMRRVLTLISVDRDIKKIYLQDLSWRTIMEMLDTTFVTISVIRDTDELLVYKLNKVLVIIAYVLGCYRSTQSIVEKTSCKAITNDEKLETGGQI